MVLALAAMLGCQPGKAEKKSTPQSRLPQAPAEGASVPAATDEAKPAAKDLPGVETPVKEMPNS